MEWTDANENSETLPKIRLFPKGFLFTDETLPLNLATFDHMEIGDGYHYYCERGSESQVCRDRGGDAFLILHGHYAVPLTDFWARPSTTPPHLTILDQPTVRREDVPEELLKLYLENYDAFLNALDFIGGRYVVIVGRRKDIRFYQDASGLRTVYYSLQCSAAASHAALLHEWIPHDLDPVAVKIHRIRFTFDTTPYVNIKSMIANHYLNFHGKKLVRFYPREPNRYSAYSESERIRMLEKLWKEQFRQYVARGERIIFSLTGGMDSRISLALSREYKDQIAYFTYYWDLERLGGQSVGRDRETVSQIVSDCNLPHRFFHVQNFGSSLSTEDSAILAKNTFGNHGKFLIPLYQREFPEPRVLHVRSNVSDVSWSYYMRHFGTENSKECVQRAIRRNMLRTDSWDEPIGAGTIRSYVEEGTRLIGYDRDLFGYHRLDLAYLEVRMARWASEIENETDICFETFVPFNMRAIIEISLSFPIEKRLNYFLEMELINRNWPMLNFYQLNNAPNLYERYQKKCREASRLAAEKQKLEDDCKDAFLIAIERVEQRVEGNHLFVKLHLLPGYEGKFEFAWYLMRGKATIEKRFYEPENEHTFSLAQSGLYRVRCFLRFRKLTRAFDTEPVAAEIAPEASESVAAESATQASEPEQDKRIES